jgi:TonB family protein
MMKMKRVICPIFLMALLISVNGTIQNPQQTQSPDFIKSNELNSAAVKLFNEGKYDEAFPLALQALSLRTAAVGLNDPELIPLLTNLGEITKRKDLELSSNYYTRALGLAEKAYGQTDIRLTTILDPLAFVEYTRKRTTVGEDLFRRSLRIKEIALGPRDPEIAVTAFNLAQAYAARAQYKDASPLLERAIAIWDADGKSQAKLTKALEAYVFVLTGLGKRQEANKAQDRLARVSAQDVLMNVGVLNGKALALVPPPYPMLPTGYPHPSGEVQVEVLINENGQVLTAKALRSKLPIEFDRVAENAARQSRFTPTFVDGKPTTVRGVIIYKFHVR